MLNSGSQSRFARDGACSLDATKLTLTSDSAVRSVAH